MSEVDGATLIARSLKQQGIDQRAKALACYIIYAMQAVVSKQIEAYVAFPPRQKPASFNLDALLRKLQEANSSANH
jgi:hypothetical protein